MFIAFEGGEGAGKSTQLRRAAQWLRDRGHDVVETREPGGTALGRELRRLLLDPADQTVPDAVPDSVPGIVARAEALLYAADRAQHVEAVIRPALAAGRVVLTDRFVDSTLAYQGAGRGLSVADARVVTDWATGGLQPDLTVLLDLDPRVGLARARARSSPDRLEAAALTFHEDVRAGFLALAAAEPQRYVVLDAHRSPDDLAGEVAAVLESVLGRAPTG